MYLFKQKRVNCGQQVTNLLKKIYQLNKQILIPACKIYANLVKRIKY